MTNRIRGFEKPSRGGIGKYPLHVRHQLNYFRRQGKAAASLKHVDNAPDDSEDDMAEIRARRAIKQANGLKVKPTTRKTPSLAPAEDKSGMTCRFSMKS